MSSVSLQDFDLTNIDMAYAISQWNLNNGLSAYLNHLPSQAISWGFDFDDGKPVPPQDPANPNYSFTGNLCAPAAPTWILDLSQSGAANQVTFNVGFSDATFHDNLAHSTYSQTGDVWVTPFVATLTQSLAVVGSTPPSTQAAMNALIASYGDVFDLNQVLIDLGQLTPAADVTAMMPSEFAGVTGEGEWTFLVACMAAYLSANEATIFTALPAAGYTATANGQSASAPLPTVTPTAAQFVIVPNTASPGLSALVWALMVDNDPMPATPANDFDNVVFFDDMTVAGVAILSSRKFIPFLCQELSEPAVLTNATPYIVPVCDGQGNATWSAASISNPGPIAIEPLPLSGPCFAKWQTSSTPPTADCGPLTFLQTSSVTNNVSLSFTFQQNGVTSFYNQFNLAGTLQFFVGYGVSDSGEFEGFQSPTFEYDWYQDFDISADSDTGGVAFSVSANNFPAGPTGETGSWSGSGYTPFQTAIQNDLGSNAMANLQANLKAGFHSAGGAGDFVFPGAGTFTFGQAGVTMAFALYLNLMYEEQ